MFRRSPELPLTWQDVNSIMDTLMRIETKLEAIYRLLGGGDVEADEI